MNDKSKVENKPEVALEEVTLIKEHTHRGEKKNIGDKISVNAHQKAWLLQHGVIGKG